MPSRCRLPSIAAAMFAASMQAGPPRSQSMPPGPATLVATTKSGLHWRQHQALCCVASWPCSPSGCWPRKPSLGDKEDSNKLG